MSKISTQEKNKMNSFNVLKKYLALFDERIITVEKKL